MAGGVPSSTSWTFGHEIEALHPDEVWISIGCCKPPSQNAHLKQTGYERESKRSWTFIHLGMKVSHSGQLCSSAVGEVVPPSIDDHGPGYRLSTDLRASASVSP